MVDFLLTNLRNDVAYEACYAAEARVDGPSRRSEQIINYKQLYNEVIDTIASMIKNRFKDAERCFSFLDLVNPQVFSNWQNGVPADKLLQLEEKYADLFDIPSLESQLKFVYKDQDFLKNNPMELLQYIYDMNIQGCFPEFV